MKQTYQAGAPWADPENSVFFVFFSLEHISQRAVRASLEEQLDPMGPIASRGGYEPVFPRKPLVTCDFLGGSNPCPPSGSTHVLSCQSQLLCHYSGECILSLR